MDTLSGTEMRAMDEVTTKADDLEAFTDRSSHRARCLANSQTELDNVVLDPDGIGQRDALLGSEDPQGRVSIARLAWSKSTCTQDYGHVSSIVPSLQKPVQRIAWRVIMLGLFLGGLLLFASYTDLVFARRRPFLPLKGDPNVIEAFGDGSRKSLNVSGCPGYTLNNLVERPTGLTAQLSLAGPACNAFGVDIGSLIVEVTYETEHRLHVNISDTANQNFRIPESIIPRPEPPTESLVNSSDLEFNYDPNPFAFWITRRSEPDVRPLFDTRIGSLPKAPIPPSNHSDPSTAFDGFPLVFEDQYLQIASALPLDANVYGLGEVLASSGFRRDVGTRSGNGTIQTLWALGSPDPIDQNTYSTHPVYLEHRFDEVSETSQSHGVFLMSSAGADILLQTPAGSNVSLIEYRLLGGVLDFYFFSGPSPQEVIEQYGEVVGFPAWQPYWGFGFHLCKWGYNTVNQTKEAVERMRAAGIPLEVIWNDLDLYHDYQDFTSDPVRFPGDEMRELIRELASNHQHYIPILDPAIPKPVNSTDIYEPYTKGAERKVFMNNPDGSEYVDRAWPGYVAIPDWFAENTQSWWTEALKNWTEKGVEFSGLWLDKNEASAQCGWSCGTGIDISDRSLPFPLPGMPGNEVRDYPEGYNATIFGPSGNVTVNGTLTFRSVDSSSTSTTTLSKRGLGSSNQTGIDINNPPYAIHNAYGALSVHGIATNTTHAPGYPELDVHNLWGLMEERATYAAVADIWKGKRPFVISRSTFPSSGKWTGHWLGDNISKWQYLYQSIQGVLQFQLFQIPMVGADACGFNGNTGEELCNRWMQLAAFTPFYRNHNVRSALPQEPYRWDSVANASKITIAVRYSMLPYWYTLFANASLRGTPPVRALWWEFPDEPELFVVDRQFMVGHDILVTPALAPNVTTVDGIFPGRGKVTWRDWYTHDLVNASVGANTTLSAPLGHVNVHIRDGSALLLHQDPGYTTEETRLDSPFSLVVSLDKDGHAFGNAYIDDGISYPPGPSTTLSFEMKDGALRVEPAGTFEVVQRLAQVTVLGVKRPNQLRLQGEVIGGWEYRTVQEKLVLSNISVDLNRPMTLSWA